MPAGPVAGVGIGAGSVAVDPAVATAGAAPLGVPAEPVAEAGVTASGSPVGTTSGGREFAATDDPATAAGAPGAPGAPGNGEPAAEAWTGAAPGVPSAEPADGGGTTLSRPLDVEHLADDEYPAEGTLPEDPLPVSGPPLATSPPGSPVAEASPDTVLPAPEGPAAGAATALRAPTMLTPIITPDEPTVPEAPPPDEAPESPPPDPEQVLSAYRWRFHHETLRELVEDPDELRAIRDRLTEKVDLAQDNRTRARLLSLRAVVSRILGELGKALADGKLALGHAEATGELRRIAIAQARLAHVLQWRGDFAEADRLFEEANSSELPDRLRATMHEHAGRSCYDQGRYIEACNHFEKALELRKVEDPDLIARTELALDAVFSKVAQQGWGPYPRDRDVILQVHRPPVPAFSERMQRWGYTTPDGESAILPSYADAQPFHDRVAWVRRPEARTWELIDESGELLIGADAGYLGVGSFADGLAWVSRDGTGGWIAVDRNNRVVIGQGCDDVRPFRRGVAAIRRGGWGAVDKTGREVLPTRYAAFATALTDGRYVEGFTDEGLAIVDLGGRKGVVDRTGRVIVSPAYPAMVIHPVAFLIATPDGQWGALDRRGELLIDPVHPSRNDVMDEIDRLLADTKPVL
ncbi:tetratricopeptide repeat protein [Micromonospora sp. NBC_01699]|uniref:tetratricopeptide repeat protein n=1 Tax=Micromonospora sp. NBC_01699 TaxID=2975984 RepID=UPI002E2973DA|nr:tetratricopeptide repeat protein [Micromonospora sp. NBC_01699]